MLSISRRVLISLFLIVCVTFCASARAQIVGAVSWDIGTSSFSAPAFDSSGTISFYAELDTTLGVLRLRLPTGVVIKQYTNIQNLASCMEPTGGTLQGRGTWLLIFCSGSSNYYAVMLNILSDSLRIDTIQAREAFYPSSEAHPSPLLFPRETGASANDALIVASRGSDTYCVGVYTTRMASSVCQSGEIRDFYFATAPVTSGQSGSSTTYLITETITSAGLVLASYDLQTFENDVDASHTATILFDESSKPVRSNVNDANASAPVVAYVQATMGTTLQLSISIRNVLTLETVTQGSVDTGISNTVHGALAAYVVRSGTTTLLLVQTHAAVVAVDFNALLVTTTPLWTIPSVGSPVGLLITPLRSLTARAMESHRRRASPSYADYNPYHLIQGTNVGLIVGQSTYSLFTLANGTLLGSVTPGSEQQPLCGDGDKFAALTTLDASGESMYAGCLQSGKYTYISTTSVQFYYTIQWPQVYTSSISPLGYFSGQNVISLSNGTGSFGVGISPIPLYTSSLSTATPGSTSAAYSAGAAALVYFPSTGEAIFNLFKFGQNTTTGGQGPMTPTATSTNIGSNSSRVTGGDAHVVFFGSRKRYILAMTSLNTASVFSATNGAKVSDLNFSSCVPPDSKESPPVSFLESVEHRGAVGGDYYVAVGGTPNCIFEVNDTLVSRVSPVVTATQDSIIGTTATSAYKYISPSKTLDVFGNVFTEQASRTYTIDGISGYAVGSNVIVYVKDQNITCRSVRTDTIVWTQQLPTGYSGTIIHMSYYNNTVYVVDTKKFWRYNVQYIEDDKGQSRVIGQGTIISDTTSILGATVGQGMVFAFSSQTVYAHDAVSGDNIWHVAMRAVQIPQGTAVKAISYGPADVGESPIAGVGSAYLEIRILISDRPLVFIYGLENGLEQTGVLYAPNKFSGQVIWGMNYITYAESLDAVIDFRGLSLSKVDLPPQLDRINAYTTDVKVPGEEPVIPLPPALPRGDLRMASAPAMTIAYSGLYALISENMARSIVVRSQSRGPSRGYVATCMNTNSPSGPPIRQWTVSSGAATPQMNLLEFNSNHFVLQLGTSLQFYSWSTCEGVGTAQVLSGVTGSLPSFISIPTQDRFIFLTSDQVTSMKVSTGTQEWQTPVGQCHFIKLISIYIICDGGSQLTILNSGTGQLVIQDTVSASVTMIGNNFAGIASSSQGYTALLYSTSAKIYAVSVNLPSSYGNVMAALPGKATTSAIIVFKFMTVSFSFATADPGGATALWSNDMNGEEARIGGATYLYGADSSIVIGTTNGIIMLSPTDGTGFTNISLPLRYKEDNNEVQSLKIVTVTNPTVYGIRWNGYGIVVNVNSTTGTASASFAFGNGMNRANLLWYANNYMLVGCGDSAGAVPVSRPIWGSPFSFSVFGQDSNGGFLAGVDLTNRTMMNIAASSSIGKSTQAVTGENSITGSIMVGNYAAFFGMRTISGMGTSLGSGIVYKLPDVCIGATFNRSSRGASASGRSIAWYSSNTRDCIFTIGQTASSPSFLTNLNGRYVHVENVLYGTNFGVLSTTALSVIGYDGGEMWRVSITGGNYLSSISSPDSGRGIFLLIRGTTIVDCYQVDNLVKVWSYTLNSTSTVPATYFNNSVFISTTGGVTRLSLEEFTYPCPDRAIFSISRPGFSTSMSQVVINEVYGIGYVTTASVFYAFDTDNGAILWVASNISNVRNIRVLRSGMTLLVTTADFAYFLDPFRGTILLYFVNTFGLASPIFVSKDEQIVGLGGSMSTVINLNDYNDYFTGVSSNRPQKSQPPPFRPYNYQSSDRPNECKAPDKNVTQIVPMLGAEWVSGARYGPKNAAHVSVSTTWVASRSGNTVYIARTTSGTFERTAQFTANCTGLNLFPVRVDKMFVGVRCPNQFLFYGSSGAQVGSFDRVAKNDISVVIHSNGYFINTAGRIDGVNLDTFKSVPGGAPSVTCNSNNFDLIGMPSSERIVLVCPGSGLSTVHYSSLGQMGQQMTAGTYTNFSSYVADDKSGLIVACGASGSTAYMVAFTHNGVLIVTDSVKVQSSKYVYCSIVPKTGGGANIIFAYHNGYKTWPSTGGNASTTTMNNFLPAAIGSGGIIYNNGFDDFFLRKYEDTVGKPIISALGDASGYMAVLDQDRSVTDSVVVYGSSFTFAASTSSGSIFWKGSDPYGAPYDSLSPFIYTSLSDGTINCLYVQNVSYSLFGYFKMTADTVGGQAVTYYAQPGTIGSVDSQGNVLWNNAYGVGSTAIPFAPVVLPNVDYIFVSGGGRLVAVVDKRSGTLIASMSVDTCNIGSETLESTVYVNGTTVYFMINGWSCLYIADLRQKPSGRSWVEMLTIDGITTGVSTGNFLWAPVEFANHFVFITPSSSPRNRTATVYRISNDPKERVKVWQGDILSGSDNVATYGYFIYSNGRRSLYAYDLLTGRLAWFVFLEDEAIGQVIGADATLYIPTSRGMTLLRSNLQLSSSQRRINNVTFSNNSASLVVSPSRTPFGQIVIPRSDGTIALQHERTGVQFSVLWTAEKSISIASYYFGSQATVMAPFDAQDGTGLVDLSSGDMRWLSSEPPSYLKTTGSFSSTQGLLVCSFVVSSPTCRTPPTSFITPRGLMDVYNYAREPTEKTPASWTPIIPDGGGGIPLHPSQQCLDLMHSDIPNFADCINSAIATIYVNGRGSVQSCPTSYFNINQCMRRLERLTSTCLDVITYLTAHYNAQTTDPDSPLGVCNKTEASKRCNTNDTSILDSTCNVVRMNLNVNNYENPPGYDVSFSLPVFQYPSPKSTVSVGPIVGGVIGGVAALAIIGWIGIYYLRSKKKDRDARFFDDDDPSVPLRGDMEKVSGGGDEDMKSMRRSSAVSSSKESSVDIANRSQAPLRLGSEDSIGVSPTPSIVAGGRGPKLPPPTGPKVFLDDDI